MSSKVDYFEVLSHRIRRDIIRLLYERIELSYTEILNILDISDGLLNFHLRRMSGIIKKTERGSYILTEEGKKVYRVIKLIEEDDEEGSYKNDVILRRVLAFIADGLIFLTFTGLLFDPIMWDLLYQFIGHITQVIEFHPWIFHSEHVGIVGVLISRVAGIYAHIFYAIYIFITLMEAYKGQTPGKYIMRIRVVKRGGLKLGIVESGIRNAGKIFLLPLDLIVGIMFFRRRGYIRFFDYYTDSIIEKVY